MSDMCIPCALRRTRKKANTRAKRIAKAKTESGGMRSAAREETEKLKDDVQKEVAELIERSRQEARKLKSDASEEAGKIEETAKQQHIELIDTINELVETKDRIVADIRNLLENYKDRLDENFPEGLVDLKPLDRPGGYELLDPVQLAAEDDPVNSDLAIEDIIDPDLDSLYERMDLPDTPDNHEQPATLDASDIEPIDPEEEVVNLTDIPIPNLEGEDMLFTLEDPMDELEPTVLINKDENNS
jgi:hypothetical protein